MGVEGERLLEDSKEEVRDEVRRLVADYIVDNPDCDADDVIGNIDFDGRVTEVYDSSVPIYSTEIMEMGSAPEVYHHQNELGPAFDGSQTAVNLIASSIYEILGDVAWDEIREYLAELEDEYDEYEIEAMEKDEDVLEFGEWFKEYKVE